MDELESKVGLMVQDHNDQIEYGFGGKSSYSRKTSDMCGTSRYFATEIMDDPREVENIWEGIEGVEAVRG